MTKKLSKLTERFSQWKTVAVAGFISGILAHGAFLFNKYSMADDILRFNLAATFISGRWMLGELENLYHLAVGRYIFSTPLFNGVLSIGFIACTALLLSDMLELRNRLGQIAMCTIMVSFPTVTGMFGFNFTSPYYFFATLLGTVGVWICLYRRTWYTLLAGALLAACSVGTYQANIPFITSLILMLLIARFSQREEKPWEAAVCCVWWLSFCALFMGFYFLINSTELKLRGTELLGYSGISSFGVTTLKGYLERTELAYSEFFRPDICSELFPMRIKYYYVILLAAFLVLAGMTAIRAIKKGLAPGLLTVLLLALLPLSYLLIFVMVYYGSIHSLMYYSFTLFFVFLIWMGENSAFGSQSIKRAVSAVLPLFLIFVSLVYCKYDNICYLKADCCKSQLISYCTTLVSGIKGTEGYTDDKPVVFIGRGTTEDESIAEISQFDEVRTAPYSTYGLGGFGTFQIKSMIYWTGFDPQLLPEENFRELPQVAAMPCYPDDGSIRIVNGAVVVKLSDDYIDLSVWDEIERATGYDIFQED